MACHFAAGANCWLHRNGAIPLTVLESRVALQVFAAELWRAPKPPSQSLCLELGLGLPRNAPLGRWWEAVDLVLFVDGAHDGQQWRMGAFWERANWGPVIGCSGSMCDWLVVGGSTSAGMGGMVGVEISKCKSHPSTQQHYDAIHETCQAHVWT